MMSILFLLGTESISISPQHPVRVWRHYSLPSDGSCLPLPPRGPRNAGNKTFLAKVLSHMLRDRSTFKESRLLSHKQING